MPTLRQINIHPKAQERLSCGLKRKRASDENNNDNDLSAPPPSSFAAIRTPSALLSRDPAQLATALGAPLDNIKDIRANVAEGIISDPYVGHGRHAAAVVAGVTSYCMDGTYSSSSRHHDDDDEEAREPMTDHSTLVRPPALMAGAVTALDMCARTLLLKNSCSSRLNNNDKNAIGDSQQCHGRIDCIRTGSSAVDQLLAPDNAYSSFDDGWSMPYPYKIPNRHDSSSFDMHAFPTNDDENNNSGVLRGGGVSFGMVTEFSGPPSSGKTQLALSIAAHAAFENKYRVHYISGGASRKALSRRLHTMVIELAQSSAAASVPRGDSNGNTHRMEEEEKSAAAFKALERVHVASVPDAYSLLATLTRIDNEEASCHGGSDSANNEENGTLLIVDSVSGCLGHHLSSGDVGAALANQVALTLRQLARTHDGHLGSSATSLAQEAPGTVQPRRFAVVVTNGSVAKRSLENNDPLGSSAKTTITGKVTKNKPAMGRYWHVSDVGIWLEEQDDASQRDNGCQQPINFYDNTKVVGLNLAAKKVVCATLQNHYGKSFRSITR